MKTKIKFQKDSDFEKVYDLYWNQKKNPVEVAKIMGWDKHKAQRKIYRIKQRIKQIEEQELIDKIKSNSEINIINEHGSKKELSSKKEPSNNNDSDFNMQPYIPKTEVHYIDRKVKSKTDIEILTVAYKNKFNTLLIGETGSGKSVCFRHLAYKLKLPYMRVNLNGATTPEDLLGQWIPDNGSFKWQDGVLTTFLRNGGIFVCDEINACPPEILFILHSLLDDERRIVLVQKDGEVVKAHKDFYFASSMNPDYEGTKPLNSALKDRFEVILMYDYSKNVESKLINNKKIIELSKGIRELYKKQEIETPLSTRTLIQLEKNIKIFGSDVARLMFVSKFAMEEQRIIDELLSINLDTPDIDR